MWIKFIWFVFFLIIFPHFGFSENSSFLVNQSLDSCLYNFEIFAENKTFNDKIEFSFLANDTNYTIEYWVENPLEEIVKKKMNTTNLNKKQFTPKILYNNFTIKGVFYKNNCTINKSKLVYFNFTKLDIDDDNTSNTSNISDNCDYFFDIKLKENLTQTKFEYKFITNVTNFTINYWVEDFLGNIVKNPLNTTNLNYKSYTPKSLTNLFYIKANLFYLNCTKYKQKLGTFYSSSTYLVDSDKISSKSSCDSNNEDILLKSYIKILNKKDIISKNTNELQYEIYRGNTRKRVTYIYQNLKKIGSVELEKFSTLKGRILISQIDGKNNISLKGLDLNKNFIFYNNISKKNNQNEFISKSSSFSKFYYKIINFSLNESQIEFKINTNINNSVSLCYILRDRTKVSEIINLTKNQYKFNLVLNINNSKLIEKEKLQDYPLRILCKYKKEQNKNYNYESFWFNYSIYNSVEIINISSLSSFYMKNYQDNYNLNQFEFLDKPSLSKNNKDIFSYESENVKTKKNSFFLIFIAVSLILSMFIIKW